MSDLEIEDQPAVASTLRRVGALGGILGPVCFITGWTTAGALTPGYSPLHQPISELAQIGAPYRALMTVAFIIFGIAMLVFARPLADQLGGAVPVLIAVVVAGVTAFGVAAFPLGRSRGGDLAHGAWAVTGYLALALSPLLAAFAIRRKGSATAAIGSVVAGAAAGVSLAATTLSTYVGLFQRLGLTIVDLWFIAVGISILIRHREASNPN